MSLSAWIEMVDEDEADGELRQVYDRCAATTTGRVANIYKIHSLNPKTMLAHRALYRSVMFGRSPLKRYQREMIGTLVSALNGCHY